MYNEHDSHWIKAGLATITLMVVGALLWPRAPELDNEFCPADQAPRHQTSVLIDHTDPLPTYAAAQLTDMLFDATGGLARYERLALYVLDSHADGGPLEVMARCNRGSGEQANEWTETPVRIEERWQEDFAIPISQMVTELTMGESQPWSHLFEAIALVTNDPSFRGASDKRLVIVSDMLHNTPQLSHYRRAGLDSALDPVWVNRQWPVDAERPDLSGVDAVIFYVPRAGTPQGVRHQRYWREQLELLGAASVKFVRLVPLRDLDEASRSYYVIRSN